MRGDVHEMKERLKISFPPEKEWELWRRFYELKGYAFNPEEEPSDGTVDTIDSFAYGLKKVLERFRGDNYGPLAKHRELIDNRCGRGIKKRVLNFLKAQGVIQEAGILYKCDSNKLTELKIHWNAIAFSSVRDLKDAYECYRKWFDRY